ncbi:hypothetical protein [Pyruvatibacter sp.]|uniref:hypothetical protein n=1 Tax=Pyruvatibacter sp. TaxID=1981328 RepID=UPI0032646E6D
MAILRIGVGYPYADFASAQSDAGPNDTLLYMTERSGAGSFTYSLGLIDQDGLSIGISANRDVVEFELADGIVSVTSLGASYFRITGNSLDNHITTTTGPAYLVGGAGNDTFVGGSERDIVSYASSTSAIRADLATGVVQDGFGGTDILIGIERIYGSVGDDLFFANDDQTRITDVGGLDTLSFASSQSGQAIDINRYEGIERFIGTEFNDVFRAPYGSTPGVSQFMDGSDGFDVLDLTDAYTATVVVDFRSEKVSQLSSSAELSFDNFEHVIGSRGGSVFIMAPNTVAEGAAGFRHDLASFRLNESAVTASLNGTSQTAADADGNSFSFREIDSLEGSQFDDFLSGNGQNNRFIGLGGDDSIEGASGVDTAVYLLGADNYAVSFHPNAGHYTVRALSGEEGVDTLTDIEFLSFHGDRFPYLAIAIEDVATTATTVSDFNGDGDDDFLFEFANGNKLVSDVGTSSVFLGAADRSLAAVGDFDGDGDRDLLFQFADGNKLIASVGAGSAWLGLSDRTAKAVGDFDGDGDDDILFEFANGNKLIGSIGEGGVWLGLADRSVRAVGDFDGDGDDDVVFEFADGNKLIANFGSANTWLGAKNQTIAAVGDFDGDGDDDIIFQLADGNKFIANIGQGNSWLGVSNRTIVGVGDFDGDGDDDILFEMADGNKFIVNVGQASTWLGGSDRVVKSIGDFDGDGDADILMQFSDGNKLIANVGEASEWLAMSDRDVIGADLAGLGLAIEIA